MGLFQKKQNKPADISGSPFGAMTKLARNKTLGEMRKSLIVAQKEKRLIFHENGTSDYTDKKGKHGVYNDEQLSAVLWKVFDDNLSTVKFGGMTGGLDILAITEIDIQTIIKEMKGGIK